MTLLRTLFIACFLIASTVGAQELTRQPYLQNLRQNSVEILWMTDQPTETWVEVRPAGGGEVNHWHSNIPTTFHQIKVPNLNTDTVYEYRVGYGEGKFFGDEMIRFQTAVPDDTDTFEFVVYGDHRNNPAAHKSVVDAILAKAEERGMPRFIIDTGDFTGQGEARIDPYNEEFFHPAQEMLKQVALFPAIGNHESPTRHPRIPHRYLKYFSVPTDSSGTPYYYSFRFGNAHFVIIDSWATDYTEGSKQWEWIRQELRDSDAQWKFTAFHHHPYIHRVAPNETFGDISIREHLVPLFEEFGVAAVFNGHGHFYQRSEVNDVAYIVTGGGGAPLYTPGGGADYVRAYASTYHYVWVRIEGDKMTGWAYDYNNDLIETFTIGYRVAITPTPVPVNFVRRLPGEDATRGETIIVESRDADGNVTPPPIYREGPGMHSSIVKSTVEGLVGDGTRFSDNTVTEAWAEIAPPIEEAGTYLVSLTLPSAGSVNAPNTIFEVRSPGQQEIIGIVDLSATNMGNRWYDLGLFELAPGATIKLIEVEDQPARFYIDAVRFTKIEE